MRPRAAPPTAPPRPAPPLPEGDVDDDAGLKPTLPPAAGLARAGELVAGDGEELRDELWLGELPIKEEEEGEEEVPAPCDGLVPEPIVILAEMGGRAAPGGNLAIWNLLPEAASVAAGGGVGAGEDGTAKPGDPPEEPMEEPPPRAAGLGRGCAAVEEEEEETRPEAGLVGGRGRAGEEAPPLPNEDPPRKAGEEAPRVEVEGNAPPWAGGDEGDWQSVSTRVPHLWQKTESGRRDVPQLHTTILCQQAQGMNKKKNPTKNKNKNKKEKKKKQQQQPRSRRCSHKKFNGTIPRQN